MRVRDIKSMGGIMAASFVWLIALQFLALCDANDTRSDYSARIVRGQNAPSKRFDYMCSLLDQNHKHVCGAVLIDPEWVLTAAHCVHPDLWNAATFGAKVAIGAHKITDDDSVSGVEVIKVDEIHRHENYQVNQEARGGDIALLKLGKPSSMIPCPLPNSDHHPRGSVIALGWGENSPVLQQISLDVKSLEDCKTDYPELGPHIICASSEKGDTCTGDSGGPILKPDSPDGSIKAGRADLDSLIGLISFGDKDCANPQKSGGYTLVAPYRDWIKSIQSGTIVKPPPEIPTTPPPITVGGPALDPAGCGEGNSRTAARAACAKAALPTWSPKAVTYSILPIGSCQGILIHPLWIVTAGECLIDSKSKKTLKSVKVAGMASAGKKELDGKPFVHPDFVKSGENNVGLIQLSERQDGIVLPMIPGSFPKPINSRNLTTFILDHDSSEVHEVIIDQLDGKKCGGSKALKKGEICAGTASDLLCLPGTSGAPLLQESLYNSLKVVGILSSGPPSCSGSSPHPVTYQRVPSVVDWMRETIALS